MVHFFKFVDFNGQKTDILTKNEIEVRKLDSQIRKEQNVVERKNVN